jgi:VWFA-related protein
MKRSNSVSKRRAGRLALVALTVAGAAITSARQQQPVFRGGTELVEVDAVVTDKKGQAVRGLTAEDFVVTENGVPQPIASFGFVDVPIPAASAAPDPTPASSAVVTNGKRADGRMYVIVLDSFHVDAARSTTVRDLAQKFIAESIGPDDVAAVVVLGHGAVNQQFTSNKMLLSAAVAPFIGQKSKSATVGRNRDDLTRSGANGGKSAEQAAEDAEMGARAIEARIAYEGLKQICETLGPIQGHRRSLVLFSEGSDFDTSDLIGEDKRPTAGGQGLKHESSKYASDVMLAQQDLMIAARRANVAIYAIDPRGTTIGDEDLMNKEIQRDISGRPVVPHQTQLQEANRSSGTLRTFASDTGGLAIVGTNNIAKGFASIVQANSAYYVLAYSPSNTAADGSYRKISVSVKQKDTNVVARQGYFAAAPSKPAAAKPPMAPTATAPTANAPTANAPTANAPTATMRELLASPLPVAGLGLRVAGGPARTVGGKSLIAIVAEIDTRDLTFTESNGQLANDIELAFVALDAQGTAIAGNRTMGNLRLPASERAALTHGLRYIAEFPASAGVFQVRVAVSESAGGTSGSALLDVTAPEFGRTPLVLGTVLLSSASASSLPTTGAFPVVKASMPTPPTASRSFSSKEPVVALASAMGSAVKSGVTLAITVRDANGRDAGQLSAQSTAAQLSADGYSVGIPVTLPTLAPGAYTMTIEARAGSGKPATTSIGFVIER